MCPCSLSSAGTALHCTALYCTYVTLPLLPLLFLLYLLFLRFLLFLFFLLHFSSLLSSPLVPLLCFFLFIFFSLLPFLPYFSPLSSPLGPLLCFFLFIFFSLLPLLPYSSLLFPTRLFFSTFSPLVLSHSCKFFTPSQYHTVTNELSHGRHDVRIWSYINCNWDAQPMWQLKHANGVSWGDSRIEGT
jgi:hypothetical protein